MHHRITCTIVPGLGEGGYYMSQKEYIGQFETAFHFTPYPGTLNLNVNKEELKKIAGLEPVEIKGFSTDERTFGDVIAYPIKISSQSNSADGALIMPRKTNHNKDIIEIIAKENLKEYLKVNDGDKINIELTG